MRIKGACPGRTHQAPTIPAKSSFAAIAEQPTEPGQTKKGKIKHETSKLNSHCDGDCLHWPFAKRASGSSSRETRSRSCRRYVQHGGRHQRPCSRHHRRGEWSIWLVFAP